MPSSPGYVRNYREEDKTAKERGEKGGHDSGDAVRGRARRLALKKGMVKPGQDLDHIQPLSKGGGNDPDNFRAETPHQNRSFPRGNHGQLLVNHEKTKG